MNCMLQRTAAPTRLQRPANSKLTHAAHISTHHNICTSLPVHLPACGRCDDSLRLPTRQAIRTRAQAQEDPVAIQERVAEDAASFDFNKQSVKSWGIFFGLLTTVMGALYLVSPGSEPCEPSLAFI